MIVYKLTEQEEGKVEGLQQKRLAALEAMYPLFEAVRKPLEDLCISEEEACLEAGVSVEQSIQKFFTEMCEDNFMELLLTIRRSMLAEGTFIIPVQKNGEELKWSMCGTHGKEIWFPVFTSLEMACYWIEECELRFIPMKEAIDRAYGTDGIDGILINPGTDSFAIFKSVLPGVVFGFAEETEGNEGVCHTELLN